VLAPPSPRSSRRRSRDTRLRLAAPSLRRSAPFEVAIGRASAAVAPPALTEYRAFEGGGAGRRWRSYRHEPRGGGRCVAGGGSRRHVCGEWRSLRSPAANRSRRRPSAFRRVRGAVNSEQRGAGMPPATSLADAVVQHPERSLEAVFEASIAL